MYADFGTKFDVLSSRLFALLFDNVAVFSLH